MTEGELLKIRDPSIPLDDRWVVFEPFWEMIRNTGYARAIEIAARENVAKVLASKVEEGVYSMEQAKKYASWILRENPMRLFFPKGLLSG